MTVADREAEELLRSSIQRDFPDHGILGEEFGELEPGARVRWILDPIDGTKSFVRGVPLFGVLIGVEIDTAPVVGVMHFPALGETVAAGQGLGCTLNGSPCRVSEIGRLEDATLLTTGVTWAATASDAEGFRQLTGRVGVVRAWGDCYGHALVATGRADIMVDHVLNPWDAAPLLTIVTEAGGRYTDLGGNADIHGGSGVSTNGLLHDEVLRLLAF